MLRSKESLLKTARELDYKPEILEKVYSLLTTLKQFMSVPYLQERLVLKGGTALNLFTFDEVPRLSVDIDLNYIGQLDREEMIKERQVINDAIKQILQQNKFELYRNPGHHAGGKMVWRYQSVLGQGGNIEIDLNYMYRRTLWPCVQQKPKLPFEEDFTVPILDIHELAAGKLSALFTRQAGRDFFDAHCLFTKCQLEPNKLRLAFVVYLAMTSIKISDLGSNKLQYDLFDIRNKLLPVLRQQKLPRKKDDLKVWADEMLEELKVGLKTVLPLRGKELEFIELIRESGIVQPELITEDKTLQDIILIHPAIKWAVIREGAKQGG